MCVVQFHPMSFLLLRLLAITTHVDGYVGPVGFSHPLHRGQVSTISVVSFSWKEGCGDPPSILSIPTTTIPSIDRSGKRRTTTMGRKDEKGPLDARVTTGTKMAAEKKRARIDSQEMDAEGSKREASEGEGNPTETEEEEESETNSEEEIGEDRDGDDGTEQDHIDVDIEFYDPKEEDFLGIKSILQLYMDGEPFSLSELADRIIQQKTVGSVVKTGEDGDPIGIISVLNLHKQKNMAFVKEIEAHLRSKCPEKEFQKELDKVFNAQEVGLIVSERLLNCPPSMSAPLQDAIFDEIAWATEDEPTEELRKSFIFQKYLMISRVYQPPGANSAKRSHGSSTGKGKGNDLIFLRPEDEFFFECCSWYRTYPCARVEREGDLQQLRLVMTVPAKEVDGVRSQLHRVFAT